MNRARGCPAQLARLRFCSANAFSNLEKQIWALEFSAALEPGTGCCWVPSVFSFCDDSIDSAAEHSRMRLRLVSCAKLSVIKTSTTYPPLREHETLSLRGFFFLSSLISSWDLPWWKLLLIASLNTLMPNFPAIFLFVSVFLQLQGTFLCLLLSSKRN